MAVTSLETPSIADVAIPDSKLGREITELVMDTESPLLFHHSSRVYCWGALAGMRRGLRVDPELLYAGVVEFGFEVIEVAERLLNHLCDRARWIASALRLHDLPEHGVIDMASAVVADGSADVFGNCVEVADEILGRLAGELRVLLEGGVQILHICTVVHVVMQSHRLLIDGGIQCVIGIRQWG